MSNQPLCSWTEAKFQYPKAKEISEIIRSLIEESKGLVSQKHPNVQLFLQMNCNLLTQDMQKRIANCQVLEDVGYDESSLQKLVNEYKEAILEHEFEDSDVNSNDMPSNVAASRVKSEACLVSLRNLFE